MEKTIELPQILSERKWYEVEGEVSINGEITISLVELKHLKRRFNSKVEIPSTKAYEVNDYLLIAAREEEIIKDYFNGKIESPQIKIAGVRRLSLPRQNTACALASKWIKCQ